MSLVRRAVPWAVLWALLLGLRYAWGNHPPLLVVVALLVLLSAYLVYSIVSRGLEAPKRSSLADVEKVLAHEEATKSHDDQR
jgi:hypothetical protein